MDQIIPSEKIENRIYLFRGQKVMLDTDLASLYEVETKTLNRAVQRNIERFPEEFMFQLNPQEEISLRYHFGTSNTSRSVAPKGRGGRRYLPYAFTEQGVAMLSAILKSPRAVQVSIQIMKAFVRLREILASHKDLAKKMERIEKKYDHQFKVVFDAIRQLMEPSVPAKRKIGFVK